MFVYLIVAAGLNLRYVIGQDRGIFGGPPYRFSVEDPVFFKLKSHGYLSGIMRPSR